MSGTVQAQQIPFRTGRLGQVEIDERSRVATKLGLESIKQVWPAHFLGTSLGSGAEQSYAPASSWHRRREWTARAGILTDTITAPR